MSITSHEEQRMKNFLSSKNPNKMEKIIESGELTFEQKLDVIKLSGSDENYEICKKLLDMFPELGIEYISKSDEKISQYAYVKMGGVKILDEYFGLSNYNCHESTRKLNWLLKKAKPSSSYSHNIVAINKIKNGFSMSEILEKIPEKYVKDIRKNSFRHALKYSNKDVLDNSINFVHLEAYDAILAMETGFEAMILKRLDDKQKKKFLELSTRSLTMLKKSLNLFKPKNLETVVLSALDFGEIESIEYIASIYNDSVTEENTLKSISEFSDYLRKEAMSKKRYEKIMNILNSN